MRHPLLIWGVLFVGTAHSMNLQRPAITNGITTTTSFGGYFLTDLPPQFMPLCGNGRIDSVADYQAYFQTAGHAKLNVSRGRLLDPQNASDNAIVEVQLSMAEICDDGNRRDGDGCSADCVSLDLFVSTCDIAAAAELGPTIEDFVFMPESTAAIVSATNGLYVINNQTATRRLVSKGWTTHAMAIFGGRLFVYTGNDNGGVYAMSLTNTTSELTKLFSIPMTANNERGYFYETQNKLYLVCKDATRVWLWDVAAATAVQTITADTMPPVLTYARYNTDTVLVTMQNYVFVLIGPSSQSRSVNRPILAGDFWTAAKNLAFQPYLAAELVGDWPMAVTLVPAVPAAAPFNAGINRVISPVVVVESRMSPRWLLDPTLSAQNLTAVLFMGAPAIVQTTTTTTTGACGDNGGQLNIPIDYNVLSKAAYSNSRTYFDVLADAMQGAASTECNHPEIWNASLETFSLAMRELMHDRTVAKVSENPVSKSLWLIQGGVLKEIARRGVAIENARGQCVPTTATLCPSACQWQPNCVPCPPNHTSLEWHLQCQACVVTATGLLDQQRRLLSSTVYYNSAAPANNNIVLGLAGCTEADITAVLGDLNPTIRAQGDFWEISIETTTPQPTMRVISARIADFSSAWQIVTRPRLLLRLQEAAAPRFMASPLLMLSSSLIYFYYISRP